MGILSIVLSEPAAVGSVTTIPRIIIALSPQAAAIIITKAARKTKRNCELASLEVVMLMMLAREVD